MAVLGLGIGLVLPVLVLAVQNSVRPADLGAATSANNYFRQIGGSRRRRRLRHPVRRPARHAGWPTASRTAHSCPTRSRSPRNWSHALPAPLRDVYVRAYADAMPRIFLYLVPVLVLGFLIAFLLKEKPLVTQHGSAVRHASGPPAHRRPRRPAPANRRRPSTLPGSPCAAPVQHADGTTVARAALTLIDVAGRQVGRGATGEDGRYALAAPRGAAATC